MSYNYGRVILGAGGFAREVLDLYRDLFNAKTGTYHIQEQDES